jgi:hypothetical protein
MGIPEQFAVRFGAVIRITASTRRRRSFRTILFASHTLRSTPLGLLYRVVSGAIGTHCGTFVGTLPPKSGPRASPGCRTSLPDLPH